MAARIRMKKMGRSHRPYYRIVAIDSHSPQSGRVLEELGTYDPMISETDARVVLNGERVNYWLSVGALPTEKTAILIKKYGLNGTNLAQQKEALERLAAKRRRVIPAPKVQSAPAAPAEPQQPAEETAVEASAE